MDKEEKKHERKAKFPNLNHNSHVQILEGEMFMEFDNEMGSPFENTKKEKKNWTKIAGLIIPE